MIIKSVAGHDHAQAKEYIYDNGSRSLISYTTTVITIDEEGWLHVYGLYSMTTIKHIGWFMREMGFTYQLAKQLFNDNAEMNVYTGEVRFNG